MSAIKYVEGDLFAAVDADKRPGITMIPHICNNKNAFGAGFVVPLAKRFPLAKMDYHDWYGHRFTESITTGEFGLGETQFVTVEEPFDPVVKPKLVVVANMVAQTLGGKRPLSYAHLAECMLELANHCHSLRNYVLNQPLYKRFFPEGASLRIAAPMFGSGLAGGDWNFIERLIEDCWLRNGIEEITVYYLKQYLPANWALPQTGVREFTETEMN